MSKQPSDFQARQDALDPQRSFLVQAPAGSGKTELVTDRILSLLAIVEQPEQVLAITFTRKAAGEMRSRVIEKLKAGLEPRPTEEHKQLSWDLAQKVLQRNEEKDWHLLAYPSRLRIMTFDSLCAGLVRTMPWSSNTGGGLDISESTSRQYHEAAFLTLKEIDSSDELKKVLEHLNVDLQLLENAIVHMLAIREQWQEILDDPARDLNKLINSLNDFIEKKLEAALDSLPLGFESDYIPYLVQWAQDYEPLASLRDIDVRELGTSVDDVDRWQALAHSLLTNNGTIRSARGLNSRCGVERTASYKEGLVQFFNNTDTSFVEPLNAIRSLPTALVTDEQIELYPALVKVLKQALESLHEVHRRDGAVDFIEVSTSALKGLGSVDEPADLLLALDARIQHLLVDEFQDTSKRQVELIGMLTSGWEPQDGRTVFLVGDPMQSIYRFRKAEVSLFIQVAEEQRIHDVPLTVLNLRENFRSVEGIVEWNNEVYKQTFPQTYDAEFGAVSYEHSVAFNGPGADEPVQHYPYYYSRQNLLGVDDRATAETKAEQQVVELAQAALARHHDKDKPVAILVKSRTALGGIFERLLEAGVPVRAVDMFPLSEQPYVIDLLQVIRALTYRYDRVAWLSLYRSPLCGLTLNSLHAIFGDDKEVNAYKQLCAALADEGLAERIGAEQFARFKQASEVMLNQSAEQQGLSFTMRVAMIWEQLGGNLLYAKASEQADLESVFALLDRFAPYGTPDLETLEQHIGGLFAESVVSGPAVEIMTIHRSKGLQFEEVILYGLHKSRITNPGTPLLQLEPYTYTVNQQTQHGILLAVAQSKQHGVDKDQLALLLQEREKQREILEEARLMYVATTRPCQRLHLFYLIALKENDGKLEVSAPSGAQFLSHIKQTVNTDVEQIKELLALGDELFASTQDDAAVGIEQQNQGADFIRFSQATIEHLQDQVNAHCEIDQHLKREAARQGGVWRFISEDDAILGTVAHSWLQMMGIDQLQGWDEQRIHKGEGLMRYQLLSAGYREDKLDEAIPKLQQLLINSLGHPELSAMLQNPKVHHEWPLHDVDGKLLIMDMVVPYEDHWHVIDFKSSRRLPEESKDDFIARVSGDYRAQLQGYSNYLQALDGKAVKASLFLMEEGELVEVIS